MPIPAPIKARLAASAVVGTVPILVHGETWISESLAISEYLDEVFPAPGHAALLPATAASRARARQIMLFLRTSLHALREARPTTSVFGRPITKPMSDKARAEATELERVALAWVVGDDPAAYKEGAALFGAWSLADTDLALALMRLIANQDPLDRRLINYALAQFDRKSVRRFVAHLPTTR
jgi:glutathione S-transferase